MSYDNPTVVDTAEIILGCDPRLILTASVKTNGTIFFSVDGSGDTDIDGLFFNIADDSTAGDLTLFSTINETTITDFETGDSSEDTLSNGAQVAETYDVKLQFGTTDDSTEGYVTGTSFILQSDDGTPLSLDDIDLQSFAAVVNSDSAEGQVLLAGDGSGGDDDDEPGDDDAETCTFLIEGDVNVEVTLTQVGDQDVEVSLSVLGGDDEDATGQIGDLRGFFFDVSDESVLDGLTVSGDHVTDNQFDAGGVNNLGNGANVNGGGRTGFDGGVEIGRQGIGKDDDIQETTFTLSNLNGLSISDFSGEDFALRLTSVGEEGGAREDSLKLEGECEEITPPAPDCPDQYTLEDVMSLMTQEIPEDEPFFLDPEDDMMDDLMLS